jgi:hypothetical protein
MSCDAERNTIRSAQSAMVISEAAGFCTASTAIAAAIASCVTRIQPRRRPSSGSG